MVKLVDSDIHTREVVSWKGLHLFHNQMSSCSQKVRIFLSLKGIDWTSHPIDVHGKENLSEYYMGINPRGLVPTLVHNGAVHIESNDILLYLEQYFPEPVLIPFADSQAVAALLRHEDDLHIALRTVSFRFMIRPALPPKSIAELASYAATGSGTVEGHPDSAKLREKAFWEQFLHGGISDPTTREAIHSFRAAFDDLENKLQTSDFIMGNSLTVVDVAWAVYVNRLVLCGYPLKRMHPALMHWYDQICVIPEFRAELVMSKAELSTILVNQVSLEQVALELAQIAGL
jgi:glutathione S-transferase